MWRGCGWRTQSVPTPRDRPARDTASRPSQCWPPRPGRRLLARRRGGMGARSQAVARSRVVWAAPPRRRCNRRRSFRHNTAHRMARLSRARSLAPAPPPGPAVSRIDSVSSAAAQARWSPDQSLACRLAPKPCSTGVVAAPRHWTPFRSPVRTRRCRSWWSVVVPTAAPTHDQRHLARLGEGATTTLAVPVAPSSIYNRMARGAQTVFRGDIRGTDPQGRRLLAPSRGVLLPEHVHNKARVEPVCCRADRVASPAQPASHTSIPPATRSRPG